MKVFISWTSADRDVKNTIVERLHKEGIDCWDSDEHCTSNYSPECIDAIKRCEVFIVIVSDASMQKGYVQNEVITARNLENEGKLNILVYKVTDAPYTDAFEFQLNHISFVTGNFVQRKESISGESGIDMLIKRAKRLLEKRAQGEAEKPFDVFMPEIDGFKIVRNGYFVESSRDEILEQMEEAFERSNVIVLHELFGFGKRSTVKKYVELHGNEYDVKVMVNNSNESLRDFFLIGLHFINVNEKLFEPLEGEALIKEKFKFLRKLDERTLLVVPNIKFEERPDEFICESLMGLKCRVILLTQEPAKQYEDWFPAIEVGRMSNEHLSELFFHHYNYALEEEQEVLLEPLHRFFDNIGGHTKTVELTASVLSRDLGIHPEDIPGYLTMSGVEGGQLKDRIMNQITHLFNMEKVSEEEIIALLVASYIAVPYISEGNYRNVLKICGLEDWQVVMNLDKYGWLDIDLRNRTVSIEPLIAQVILNKFPDNYFVIIKCFEFLMENAMKILDFSISEKDIASKYSKAEYMMRQTGHDIIGDLFCGVKQNLVDKENLDTEKLAETIAKYEERYMDEEAPEAADDGTYGKVAYEEVLKENIDGFIPWAKVISSGVNGLLTDFSVDNNSIFWDKTLGEDFLGVSREELEGILEQIKEEMEEDGSVDEDDIENMVFVEIMIIYESFINKNYTILMAHVNILLETITEFPEVLGEEEISHIFCTIVAMITLSYLKSGSFQNAIHICEKVIALDFKSVHRNILLKSYINALRSGSQYGDEMYDAYEEFIQSFESYSGEVFDNRMEQMSRKKEMLLMYAYDLSKGGRAADAQKQFAKAWSLKAESLEVNIVEVANEIVKTMINSGEYEDAIGFIERYFGKEQLKGFRETEDEETNQILDYFETLLSLSEKRESDFLDGEAIGKYMSYYREFSKKNNSFLEQKYYNVAEKALDFDFSHLKDEEILLQVKQLRMRAKREKMLMVAPEAFALASEVGLRVLGYKHHYVQYVGAIAMADGKVAEILNGEGKTYTIVLVAFLNYLYGKKVFVVDSSSYLTKRNYEWMHGIYKALGMSSEYISKEACIYEKKEKEQADVTYSNLYNLMFGFLFSEEKLYFKRSYVQYDCAIIDEIDKVLVDDAKSPYVISRSSREGKNLTIHALAYDLAKEVAWDDDYYECNKNRIELADKIYPLIEQRFQMSRSDIEHLAETQEIEQIVKTAILCVNHYVLNSDYYIIKGIPVWENTEKGHFEKFNTSYTYFLSRKNGLNTESVEKELQRKQKTTNTICVRDMFKKFKHVCGTTATAVSFQKEFKEIYHLDYVSIPPFSPCIRRDEQAPVYFSVRKKERAIVEMVEERHSMHQPILLITQSVKESERYSNLLKAAGIPHALLNAKNQDESSDMIALAGCSDSVLVATALVNRGADIKLGGDPELRTRRELVEMGVDITALNELLYTLTSEEEKSTELYRKYYSILEKNKALAAKDKEVVVAAGGLCVIGTSFFPESRTEQQTRGRSGRQGQVGESWVFYSYEDESLRGLIADNILERMQHVVEDEGVDGVDAVILYKTLEMTQKRMHAACFADIRRLNDTSFYIDRTRPEFIGKRFELAEGLLSEEDLIQEWITEQVKMLQKGKTPKKSKLLSLLYEECGEELKHAGGKKAERMILQILKQWLSELYEREEKIDSKTICNHLQQGILDAWSKYIEMVNKYVGRVDMPKHVLEKYIEEEKKKLLLEPVDSLWSFFYKP